MVDRTRRLLMRDHSCQNAKKVLPIALKRGEAQLSPPLQMKLSPWATSRPLFQSHLRHPHSQQAERLVVSFSSRSVPEAWTQYSVYFRSLAHPARW